MWHNSQINSCLLVQIKHVIDTFNIYANKQYICFVKSISFSYKSSLVKVHFVVIEIFTAKQSMIFLIKTFDYALLFLDGVMKIFLCLIDFNQRLIIFQLRVCCRVFLSGGNHLSLSKTRSHICRCFITQLIFSVTHTIHYVTTIFTAICSLQKVDVILQNYCLE